ncbi:SDR family NAD(P)-dependent oxidoreductase [Halobacillus mangrovi]|uniref:Beta-ketoacyl-ACP reductase n=1 Tax=Halobacillus mangrovi TaxID=402384 RepID=A0A1W5ZUD4_9BACI|nr:SDR family NAD(P)-dependent oxidoreductase [Halobacillus mangrovi]ARI76881.1 beta-ketoacyl-ACP reductase [Halobacillus mangrovi]
MGQLSNKVVLITGGSKGIGKEIAKTFAKEGAKVCILDIDQEAINNTTQEFNNENYEVHPFLADITNREQVENTIDEIGRVFSRIDILVNNAGITRDNLLFKMTDEDWNLVLDVHMTGSFICSQIVQKYMVEQKFGRIINISSASALGRKGQANYSAVKAGLQGFTKTLAMELGKFGITVNAVAPGFIETDMTKALAERLGVDYSDLINDKKKEIPVNRPGSPADVAYSALFFALDTSSFVNGQVLYVAGGPKT